MERLISSVIKRTPVILVVALLIGLVSPVAAKTRWSIDLESGLAISGYNNVRIPGNTGTKFSLSRDLEIDQTVFWRARFSRMFGDKHSLSLLIAPLTFNAEGRLEKVLKFAGGEFAANTFVRAKYRFDSYRVTYRYDFYRREKLRFGIGFTGKIRDAAISVEDGDQRFEKTNTGFVPLINFRAQWTISPHFGLILDGDALAAPQGRAEDVLVVLTARASESLQFKIGYRLLEGGADNDEVYTFALVNYLVLGAAWRI
ncbi:MAG: hypothetical protein IPH59_12670 [bacterium]|nr:hypothetical protein [bacterium]